MKDFTVVVTGAAPFKQWNYNSSAIVRDSIPDRITREGKLPINILKYPQNIECIYTDVLALIPELWSGKRSVYQPDALLGDRISIDLMIHIGMNSAEEIKYVVEKRARRDGYNQPDEDGKHLPRDALKGRPDELFVGFDVEDIVTRIAKSLPNEISVKASDDAGLYFCELQLYLSLAALHESKEFGRVEFLHVPTDKSEDGIQRGVQVAMALITACIDDLPEDYKQGEQVTG